MGTQNAINANTAGIVGYDGAGTFTGSSLTPNAVVYAATSNTFTSQLLTNGQLQIGSTGTFPTAATLTAGTGVSITNSAGAITINAAGGGLTWTVVTGTTQAVAINNGYFANNAGQVVFTLPVTAAVGATIAIYGMNNATGWKIAQNSGQQIFFGVSSTTLGVGGSLVSTNSFDGLFLVCNVANTSFVAIQSIGNITVV